MTTKLRIHIIQHVPFEGPGMIADWAERHEHQLTYSKLYQGDALPEQRDFDWLVVMGGPMGVYDTEQYDWLRVEQEFIQSTIAAGKYILGVCLGAQLLAAAIGSKVYRHEHREIGWFNIQRTTELENTLLDAFWPECIKVFHWHGDTYDLPAEAKLIASSEACQQQGFILNNRIIGLQFHIEVSNASVATLIEHCGNELDGTRYVQSKEELLSASAEEYQAIHQLLDNLLDAMEKNYREQA